MDACKACARNIARSDRSVLCSGLCGQVFHPGCVGLNVTNFKAWAANVGLLWFCENCRVNFNPSIMDREAIIIKTMRDLLLRVDSMDLRIGQFGENLKMLNNLLSITTSIRRDSNFSSRLQQFVSSGPPTHDPSEFYNSIDRFNLDVSLRSNAANNSTTGAEEELDATMNNDSVCNDRELSTAQNHPVASLPAAISTAPTLSSTTTASAMSTATTVSTAVATTATTLTATAVAAPNRATSAAASSANSYAAITAGTSSATNNLQLASNIRSQVRIGLSSNDAPQDNCRLKVVSRSRQSLRRTPNVETVKSFYITPFHVEQSEEDVIEYLRETINIDNSTVRCVKLVPRNKNISELSFVSFKLTVSEDLVSVVSDSFYWPEGVEIREFQSKNENQPNHAVMT